MNIAQRLALHIVIINVLMVFFGVLYGKNPFVAPSVYFMILSVTLFIGTVATFPLFPIEFSASQALLSFILIIIAVATECVHPAPPIVRPTPSEMGNTPNAVWQFQLFYSEDGFDKSNVYSFTGTTEESDEGLKGIIERWNKNHPNSPITKHYKSLTYIPKEYAKANGYDPMWSMEY